MTDPVRIHIAYGKADKAAFETLKRHLVSLTRTSVIAVSHSGDFEDELDESASPQLKSAALLILLVAPAFLTRAETLIEHVLRRIPPDQPPVVFVLLLEHLKLSFAVRSAVRSFPESGLPIAAQAAPDRCYYELVKEVHSTVGKLKKAAAVSQSQSGTPSTRGSGQARAAAGADVPALSGLSKNKYALLVGANGYRDAITFPPLNFCVNDVRTLRTTLERAGYLVRSLHDEVEKFEEKPISANVQMELDNLCAHAEAEDLILVHFACHGFLRDGKQYLAFYDTHPRKLDTTALSLQAIEQQLKQSAARRIVLILDACHSGFSRTRSSGDPELVRYAFEQAEGFVRVAASTAQQKAQEYDAKKMGAFSYFLNEALSGHPNAKNPHGFVTVQSAANHLVASMRKWTYENLGMRQEPTIQYEGLGELVLVDLRTEPAKESK